MHSTATEEIIAESAAAAVRKFHAPRGTREVFAVIDSAIIARTTDAGHSSLYFAFIGVPAAVESRP